MFDFNGNGLCDPDEVFGYVPVAQNYNPEATTDDGSCQFPEGCAEETVCGLVYDGNNDGVVGSGDLLQLLTEFGQTCTPSSLAVLLPRTKATSTPRCSLATSAGSRRPPQHAVHERRQHSVERRKWPLVGFVRRG